MAKISLTGIEARDEGIKGIAYVANAVKSTMGPFGFNFLLEKGGKSTNDGFMIGNELAPTIKNEFQRRAALSAGEVASKTNDMAGDATSASWALTIDLIKESIRHLPTKDSIKAKKTSSEIGLMIEQSKNNVVEKMIAMSLPITSKEELIKSALVSVEDEKIAELLGSTQWDLGPDGIIIAEEVNERSSSIERVSGMRLDNGFGAYHLITNLEKQSMELNDVHVLMTNYSIGVEELAVLTEQIFKTLIAQKQYGIVVIGRAFTSDAIKKCQESSQAGFGIFPVNAPYVNQSEIMHDMESVLSGRYIDKEEASLNDIYISDIGFAKKFIARQMDATVTGADDEKSKVRIEKRVSDLKKKIEGEPSDFYKKMLEARIAQLSSGFAILKVGSLSLTDRKRLKDKCDDAVSSVRLALKGGTIPGGGLAFKDISDTLEEGDILKRPIRVIYDSIMASAPDGWIIEEWVRDPLLTLKIALENACAYVSTYVRTGGIITEENPKRYHSKYDEEEEE